MSFRSIKAFSIIKNCKGYKIQPYTIRWLTSKIKKN